MSHRRHNEHIDGHAEKVSFNKSCTKKELIDDKSFGFGAMQGCRHSMEDYHKHLIPFDSQSWNDWSFFAIFDGHAGMGTARYAADHLDKKLLDTFDHNNKMSDTQLHSAIKEAFVELDKDVRIVVKDHSGCVCIACLISPKEIYLINMGDSRAIIISNDGQVLAYTEDHKPDDPNEQKRIHEAGGTITKIPGDDILRVEGQLATTRVLGDFSLNKNLVPPIPDIVTYSRKSSAAFIILASDGIWDVMTNEQVASFVSQQISTKTTLENITSQLLDQCLEEESLDNMSVYIIQL